MAANSHIDSDREHLQVLFSLGLLDDMDSWPLYQAQEARFEAVDASISTTQWRQYVRPAVGSWGADVGADEEPAGPANTVWTSSEASGKHSLDGQNPISGAKNQA